MRLDRPAEHLVAPQASSHASAGFGASRLSPELLEQAVRRIGFIGLICGITAPLAYLVELVLQPGRVSAAGMVALPLFVAGGMFVLGVAVFAAAWSRKLPALLMLDLGLVFEVIVALAISLSENAGPWPPGQPIRGISWNCIWIAVFVTAVPGSFGKTVLAAFAAACMQPIGLAVSSALNHTPLPAGSQFLILNLPVFAAAGWAIPVARHINRLGAQLSRERELGSYRLVKPIGRGGMGEVWLAEHRLLARTAAIKLIRPEASGMARSDFEVLLRRFDREAKVTAGLRSPHSVTLYDYGISQEGHFYYVMELLDGADLEDAVTRFGAFPAERVIYVMKQACKSLAEAHDLGLVHRDLKPRNIFLCRLGQEFDFVKLLDFGLVKYGPENQDRWSQLTAEGIAAGTPSYMAPEAANDAGAVDARSDLYSLGCVAYWLLTGRRVFECSSAVATLMAHVQTPVTPPSERSDNPIPQSLEDLVLACLEKQPARRPASARELHDRLESCAVPGVWNNAQAERWWAVNMVRNGRPEAAPASSVSKTI